MSAQLAKLLITSGSTVATAAFKNHNEKQQALIKAEQQREQAKYDLLVGVSPHVVQLATACINARTQAIQVQQDIQRIVLEHDTNMRQANIAEQEVANNHELAMSKLHHLHERYHQAIATNQQVAKTLDENIQLLNMQTDKLMSAMIKPNLTAEDRAFYLNMLKNLQADKAQLIDTKRDIQNQNYSAFIQSCDALREGPRILTDIS